MRAEDHQMIGPLFILSLVKAGQPGVTYDEEKTGYGWKTEAFIDEWRERQLIDAIQRYPSRRHN